MANRVEQDFLFAFTVGSDGEVVPFRLVPVGGASRSHLVKAVGEVMRKEGCAGGVEVLSLELESSRYSAVVSCDAEPGVSAEVGEAFFRAVMAKLLCRCGSAVLS